VFNLWGAASPSKSRKAEPEMTAQTVVEHQRFRRDNRREDREAALYRERRQSEERKKALHDEIRILHDRISQLNDRNDHGRVKLESLKKRDDEEKWEDDLFETRMKELNSARTVIHTQSTITGEGIREQIKDLNEAIVQVAAMASETEISRPAERDTWERFSTYLGNEAATLLRYFGDRLNEKRFVQAILQMFLCRCSISLINSWSLEKPNLDSLLSRMYNRIRSKGKY
jgi:hypothetical protein